MLKPTGTRALKKASQRELAPLAPGGRLDLRSGRGAVLLVGVPF